MKKEVYEVVKIDEKSRRIEENGVRSFLFEGTEKAMLVDSGFGGGNLFELVAELTDLPVTLVNTHADRDHIGCNKMFEKAYMHPSEFDRYHQAVGRDSKVAPLWEGDILDLGGRKFEVVLIPGHTPGSIALLDEENRILVSGDSVQAGTIFMFGAGRNIDAYICSMKRLFKMQGRFDTVYPSHGAFPVEQSIISALIDGAEKIRSGKINGSDANGRAPAKLFDVGAAKFLYEHEFRA